MYITTMNDYKKLSKEWGSKRRKAEARAVKSRLRKPSKEDLAEVDAEAVERETEAVEREMQLLRDRVAARMRKAQEEADLAEKELAALYEPLVTAKIAAKDWPGAFAVLTGMPDCVSRVFFVDRIRNARGDFNK